MHIDEVKNNQFFQFPQWLLKEPYNQLSHRAMLMYMILWDRRGLSEKNNWYDKDGKVYVYFTNEQFMETLGTKSNKTIVEAKKELHKIGLLEEVQQGINKPNRLYINGSVKITHGECKKYTSGSVKNTRQDVQKLHGINTNIINTNIPNINDNNNRGGKSSLEKYYLQRIGKIDQIQAQQLLDFVGIDGFSFEMVKLAIDKTADSGARNFFYMNKILENWKKANITTIEAVAQHDKKHKFSKSKNNTFERSEYGDGYDSELGF